MKTFNNYYKVISNKKVIYVFLFILTLFIIYYFLNNIKENFSNNILIPLNESTKTSFIIEVIEGDANITFETLSLSENKKNIVFGKLKSYDIKNRKKYITDVFSAGNIGYSLYISGGSKGCTFNIASYKFDCIKNNSPSSCNSHLKILRDFEFKDIKNIYDDMRMTLFEKNTFKYDNKYFNGIKVTALPSSTAIKSRICYRVRDFSLFQQEEEQ